MVLNPLGGKKIPEWVGFGELVLEGVASCRSDGEITAPSPAAGSGSGDRVLWELVALSRIWAEQASGEASHCSCCSCNAWKRAGEGAMSAEERTSRGGLEVPRYTSFYFSKQAK